jgi:hypothetical protein
MLEFFFPINRIKVINIDDIMHFIIKVQSLALSALLEFQRHGHLASGLHDLLGAIPSASYFHFFEVGNGFPNVLHHV